MNRGLRLWPLVVEASQEGKRIRRRRDSAGCDLRLCCIVEHDAGILVEVWGRGRGREGDRWWSIGWPGPDKSRHTRASYDYEIVAPRERKREAR